MATTVYPGPREGASARVRFRDDGKAAVTSAIAGIGTGAGTMLAIAAADAAGIPLRRVKAVLGDSALPPGGSPAYGSQMTLNTVPAVREATGSALDKLVKLAVADSRSPSHGLDPDDVDYDGGHLSSADRSLGFGRLLSMLDTSAVEATAESLPGDEADRYAFYSFGAHFCEVRVNRFTREPRISRFTSVSDIAGWPTPRPPGASSWAAWCSASVARCWRPTTWRATTGSPTATWPTTWCRSTPTFPRSTCTGWIGPTRSSASSAPAEPARSAPLARLPRSPTPSSARSGTRVRDLPITLDKLLG